MSHNTAELPPLQLLVFKLCGLFQDFQHEVCATRFAMIHQPDSIQTSTPPQNLRYLKMSPPRDTSNCPSQFYSSRILARHLHQDESFQTCGRWTGARHLAWLSPNFGLPKLQRTTAAFIIPLLELRAVLFQRTLLSLQGMRLQFKIAIHAIMRAIVGEALFRRTVLRCRNCPQDDIFYTCGFVFSFQK